MKKFQFVVTKVNKFFIGHAVTGGSKINTLLSSGVLQIYLQHPQVPGARDPAGRPHHRCERHRDYSGAWLPDGDSHILRSYVFGPLGFWTMAPLRYTAKFDPFLSLDCAPTLYTLAQSKEKKGSNFAIWQHCSGVLPRLQWPRRPR